MVGDPAAPTGETFVLLHGYAGSSFSWRAWVPALAPRGRVFLVDVKGFGKAARPDDDRYAPRDQAELILRLIEDEGLTGITLVGHSLGGGVALQVALGLQDLGEAARLRRLVIVAGAAYRQRLPPFVFLARHPRLTWLVLRVAGVRLVVAQALRTMVFDPTTITGAQIDGYAAPLLLPGSQRALLASALQIVPDDLDAMTRRYPGITVPTLLLWGRQDPAVPLWVGERLHRDLPRGRLVVVERCGHLPAEEHPEATLAHLLHFLDDSG